MSEVVLGPTPGTFFCVRCDRNRWFLRRGSCQFCGNSECEIAAPGGLNPSPKQLAAARRRDSQASSAHGNSTSMSIVEFARHVLDVELTAWQQRILVAHSAARGTGHVVMLAARRGGWTTIRRVLEAWERR